MPNGIYRIDSPPRLKARLLPQSGEPVSPDTPAGTVLLLLPSKLEVRLIVRFGILGNERRVESDLDKCGMRLSCNDDTSIDLLYWRGDRRRLDFWRRSVKCPAEFPLMATLLDLNSGPQ